MKQFLIYSMILGMLLMACHSSDTKKNNDTEEAGTQTRKISKRDFSITKANAYNDLFLDSATMEAFITGQKIPDSIGRRIRSFYNARNYEFAWFSSAGLTEQARAFWNLFDYHTTYNKDTALTDKALQKRMDRLTAAETLSVNASDKSFINTELALTERFIRYI